MSESGALLQLRVLLLLLLLLLALAVTLVSAGAPVYGPGEVTISILAAPESTTRPTQLMDCALRGAVLVPDVSDAVHTSIYEAMVSGGIGASYGYMGGSSMLSSSDCTTSKASLSCIWSWDQGRYTGVDNAVAFYKGNRVPSVLAGAAMVSTTVGNFWLLDSGTQGYPGKSMQRYGVILRLAGGSPSWADSSDSKWSYGTVQTTSYYTFCAIELSNRLHAARSATPLAGPWKSSADSSYGEPRTVSPGAPEKRGVSEKQVTELVGICIAAALLVGLIVGCVLCKAQEQRCCCFSEPKWATDAAASSTASGSGAQYAGQPRGAGQMKRMHTSAIVATGSIASSDGNRSFHAAMAPGGRGRRRSLLSTDPAPGQAVYVSGDGTLDGAWPSAMAAGVPSFAPTSPRTPSMMAALPQTHSHLHSPQDASLRRTPSWTLLDDAADDGRSSGSPRPRVRRQPSVSFIG